MPVDASFRVRPPLSNFPGMRYARAQLNLPGSLHVGTRHIVHVLCIEHTDRAQANAHEANHDTRGHDLTVKAILI